MRFIAIASAMVLATACGLVLAADPPAATPSATAAAPAAPVAGDDRQKLVEAGTQFMLGKFDDALDAARALMRTATDDTLKTGATRLAAECLRKKGDWQAAGVYTTLRDRFEKGSADHVKYEAIAEILHASPAGVYPPLEAAVAAKAKPAAGGDSGTISPVAATAAPDKPAVMNLSDDAYLARALACLGAARIEKLKARITAINKARTPQEAEAALAALVEECRQAKFLAGDQADAVEQAGAQAAGRKLAEFGKQVTPALTSKAAEFHVAERTSGLTMAQRKDMLDFQALCTSLAGCEGDFQGVIRKVAGLDAGTDGAELRSGSARRQAEYARLARAFEPPNEGDRRLGGRGGAGGGGAGGGGSRQGGGQPSESKAASGGDFPEGGAPAPDNFEDDIPF